MLHDVGADVEPCHAGTQRAQVLHYPARWDGLPRPACSELHRPAHRSFERSAIMEWAFNKAVPEHYGECPVRSAPT